MMGLYLVVAIVLLCIAYAGPEETMRLFAYLDLQLRFAWIRFRMELMRRKLHRQLSKDTANIEKMLQELKK